MAATKPYGHDHQDPNGPGDARPTALKIIRDESLDGKLSGKVVLITGGTSGIGMQTARALHVTGADVFFTGRDVRQGQHIANTLRHDGKPGRVEFIEMNLGSLQGIRQAAAEFLRLSSARLNILICNAGVRGYPKGNTEDGFELHFGINHLGHFALFQALKDALASAATPSFQSRVICVSASGHRQMGIRFDDIHFEREDEYQPLFGYAQSKTANIYMALEIDRRYGSQGIHGLAVHPGGIAGTGLNRLTDPSQITAQVEDPMIARRMKSAEQGAATTVWGAVAHIWEGNGGRYLEDCQQSEPWDGDTTVLAPGYASHIYERDSAARLWEESLRMIGLAPLEPLE